MNRRDFLKGVLGAILAGVIAKALPDTIADAKSFTWNKYSSVPTVWAGQRLPSDEKRARIAKGIDTGDALGPCETWEFGEVYWSEL